MGKLPAEGIQARRFGKTRSAQSSALHEDYVELIADLLESEGEARPTDIARRLGVSHATAIKAIARLKRAGLATARPYRGVFLTEKGRALAERVRLRHRRGGGGARRVNRQRESDYKSLSVWPSEHRALLVLRRLLVLRPDHWRDLRNCAKALSVCSET